MTVASPEPSDENLNLSPIFVVDPDAPGVPRADRSVVPERAKFGVAARWDLKPWYARAREWVQYQFPENDSVLAQASREAIWDIVERERVNMLTIVGDAIAIPLLDALEANPERWNLTSIFGISSGGAVFSAAKQAAFRRHFPSVVIANAFGSSESGAMGADSGERQTGDEGLGRVARSEFMSVVNDESKPRHAQSGESGIFARAGYIPLGYYNAPEKTAETFVEVEGTRWLLTGDRARLEDDGSITIFGRGSNCINSGGEKIFPEEVEDALKAHEGVYDALVVGVPDERWGSRVAAVVSFREGAALNLEQLQAHCRQHIAAYKVPRELHHVERIPRAPSGKPDYPRAKAMALSGEFAVVAGAV